MSRVDVPTMQCDRCGAKTQDTREMGKWLRLENSHMSGHDEWDLCTACRGEWIKWMGAEE